MKKPLFALVGFWLFHVLLVIGSVPAANIIPASFAAVTLSAMSLSFVLAARWRVVESLLGGRDKAYVLHRWMGYFSFIGLSLHWLLATAGTQAPIPSIAEFASDIAMPVSIGILLLGLLSALKHIPYHIWIWSHRLFGPLFILIIFHSFFCESPLIMGSVGWISLWLVSVLGIAGWFSSLQRLFTPDQPYEITAVEHKNKNLDLRIKPLKRSYQWKTGQFCNLTPTKEGFTEAHPFSIASAPKDNGEMRFVIRELGDFSRALPKALNVGDTIHVSKPAGGFRPHAKPYHKPQVWLAGGVGITPFLATMDQFDIHSPDTCLIYCISDEETAIDLTEIKAFAQTHDNFNLHLINAQTDGFLTEQHFTNLLDKSYQQAELFICGPSALKQVAKQGWKQFGAKGKIHHEYFDFRAAVSLKSLLTLAVFKKDKS